MRKIATSYKYFKIVKIAVYVFKHTKGSPATVSLCRDLFLSHFCFTKQFTGARLFWNKVSRLFWNSTTLGDLSKLVKGEKFQRFLGKRVSATNTNNVTLIFILKMPSSVNFTNQKQYLRFAAVRRIIRKRKYYIQIFPNNFKTKV